jgi:predicted nucleic acid-binding protein
MAATEVPSVVSDAGPLIHLDELGCLDLMSSLGTLLIPQVVWEEALNHRIKLRLEEISHARIVKDRPTPSVQLQALCASLALDAGERAAIALMENSSAKLLLCDDAAARLAAESLGFSARGSLGILVRFIRTGERTREQVISLLRDLPQKSSLHISRQLLEKVISNIV